MTYSHLSVRYRIIFDSPFHCGNGLGGALVDRLARRDESGYLIVPGSTVKGIVRENCERLAALLGVNVAGPHVPSGDGPDTQKFIEWLFQRHNPVTLLFGSQLQQGGLCFDDAVLEKYWQDYFSGALETADETAGKTAGGRLAWQVERRARARMSRLTGAAAHEALFTGEYGIRGLTFMGTVSGYLQRLDYAGADLSEYARLLLLAGLKLMGGMGADRSTGAGCCRVELTELKLDGRPAEARDELNRLENLLLLDQFN